MASATFPPAVGGDGSTVTDDANPQTGLKRAGYQTRLIPALSNTVSVANFTKTKAEEALASRTAAAASAAEAKTSELAAANFANAAQQTTLGFDTNRPTIRPSLNLDFVNQQVVDRRIVVNRNSPKTYFGKEKVLGDENLLANSEQLSGGFTLINRNVEVAPDGTLTADKFNADTTNQTHYITLAVANSNNNRYFFSVYLKAAEYNIVHISENANGSGSRLRFNIATGEFIEQIGANFTNVSIEPSTNGFFRVAFEGTVTSDNRAHIQIRPDDTGSTGIYIGDGTNGIFAWGGQVETLREGQTKPTAYVRTDAYPVRTFFNKLQTAAANTMPVEFDPITQECLGIKPESQATNLLRFSEDFSNSFWTKQPGTIVETNVAVAPDGTLSADLVKSNGTNGIFSGNVSITSASNVKSIWIKSVVNGSTVIIKDPAKTQAVLVLTLTTQWVRYSLNDSQPTSIAGLWIDDIPPTGVYLWGAQLEASTLGSPSSYVPTTTAAVTRLADDLSMPVSAFEYNQNEGTLYAEVNTAIGDNGTNYALARLDDGASANRLELFVLNSSTFDRRSDVEATTQNIFQSSVFSANGAITEKQTHRLVTTFKTGQLSLFTDSVNNGTSANFNIATNISFLKISASNANVRALRYYPKALSALEAQSLSQV